MGEVVPFGYHNLFVLVLIILLSMWAAKVGHQLVLLYQLHRRLSAHPPLPLEQMSIYAKDFQQLIRQHFNQILRMRRTVPPRELARHVLAAHVMPESVRVIRGSDGCIGVSFAADVRVPCSVRLYWGVPVSACSQLLQQFRPDASDSSPRSLSTRASMPRSPPGRGWAAASEAEAADAPHLAAVAAAAWPSEPGRRTAEAAGVPAGERVPWQDLFTEAEAKARSQVAMLAAGEGKMYRTPTEELLDPGALGFELGAPWPPGGASALAGDALVPLVIAVSAMHPDRDQGGDTGMPAALDHTQVTLVKFLRRAEDLPSSGPRAEVLHQISLGEGSAMRVMGVFGFEDEDAGEADCMICYENPRSVLLMPCRHCSVCDGCLRRVRDERCPLCRSDFTAYLLLPRPLAVEEVSAADD